MEVKEVFMQLTDEELDNLEKKIPELAYLAGKQAIYKL
jgi:hypothetical protein